ncbi:hypothetical protein NC653_039058 [Populus alba x Populus x berolinensis]|uniref:Uncharacterized protein n=1 Tax=Populus alba x Populus x berolinensis TaxID=444605 RepID=A0AAD6LA98_9ROSI|nr:hypothetical protein NC653_039058 [Populus alba x Populus x berolinensis]
MCFEEARAGTSRSLTEASCNFKLILFTKSSLGESLTPNQNGKFQQFQQETTRTTHTLVWRQQQMSVSTRYLYLQVRASDTESSNESGSHLTA